MNAVSSDSVLNDNDEVGNKSIMSTPIKLIIMWAGVTYGQVEQAIYRAVDIEPTVWNGILFRVKIADWLLMATLFYTALQGCILLWEKVIKPFWNYRFPKKSSFERTRTEIHEAD